MESFITDYAKSIAEKILNLIIGEARYLCCYNCIVEDFEKEKEELREKWKTIDKDIEEAKNGGNIIKEDVKFWHEKADKLIKEKTDTKGKPFFKCCPNCVWRYRRGKELAGNVEEAKRLKECKFETISRTSKLPGVEYHSSEDFIDFESRNLAYTKLVKALKDENSYMVGLYGMGGTGKSTLVQKVGNEVKKEELFDEVVITTVSNDPNIRKIQKDIAAPLGLVLKEDDDELQRAKKLRQRLTNGQKILVILDDVWNEFKHEDIGIPSHDNHRNCKVLVTSRKLSVCTLMSCKSKIELGLLSEKDAMVLFENKIGFKDDSSRTLRKLAQQIASECKGLPVAITVVAKSLKDEPKEVWKAALKSLKEFKKLDNIDEELKVYSCFQVSYDNLKDDKAKKLFLLCSVFPEDHEIPLEDLIKFGKGLCIFGKVDSYEEARINMLTAQRKLLDCSLLLPGEQGRVKMHDLVRDAAHWIANNEIQVIVESKMKATVEWSTVKYLYFQNINKFPEGCDCSKLEILLSIGIDIESDNVKLPKAFFERMKNLRVLCLNSGHWEKPMLDMEQSIISLNNIQTLCLSWLRLDNISVLEKLEMLDTLDLRYCFIDGLPNGIVELKKLRLLSLIECEIGVNPYKVIAKLSQIQELYFAGNKRDYAFTWKFGKEIFAYFNDKDSLPPNQLQRYFISVGSSEFYSFDPSKDDSVSRGLCIEYFDPSTSNTTIKNMVQRAEILQLSNLQGLYSTITPQLVNEIRGDINDLIELKLHSCSKIEYLIDTSNIFPLEGTVFSKLVYLTLANMDNLKALCFGQPPPDFLENLQQLILLKCFQLHDRLLVGNFKLMNLKRIEANYCPMLTSLFTISIAQSLVLLESIQIAHCEKFRYIMVNEEEKEEGKQILLSGSLFPKLIDFSIFGSKQIEFLFSALSIEWSEKREDLQVGSKATQLDPSTSSSSNLKYLYSFDAAQSLRRQSFILPNVKSITLRKCVGLKSLFTLSIAATMLLEALEIDRCDGMKHILTYVRGDHNGTNYGCVFPRLKVLWIENCRNFECILGQQQLKDQTHNLCDDSFEAFPSLEELFLENCRQLTLKSINHLIIGSRSQELDSTTLKDTSTLNDIKQCKSPNYFLTLKKLRGLGVQKCPKLQALFSASISRSLPELKYLTIQDCEELEQIIEVDDGNYESSSNPISTHQYFPKLIALSISECNKLRSLFSMSTICCEFPMLKYLMMNDSSELEIFGKSEIKDEDIKVVLPKLKCLMLMILPKLTNKIFQGLELHTLKYVVYDCPNLCVTSTFSDAKYIREILDKDDELFESMFNMKANEIFNLAYIYQQDSLIQDQQEVLTDPPSELLDSKVIKMESSSISAVDLHEAVPSTQGIQETMEQSVDEECSPTSQKSTIAAIPSMYTQELKDEQSNNESAPRETKFAIEVHPRTNIPTDESIEAIIKERYLEAPTLEDAMLTTLSADLAPRMLSKGQLITTIQESLPLELTKKVSRSETTMTDQKPLGEMISDVTAPVKDDLLTSLIVSKPMASPTHPTPSLVNKETLSELVVTSQEVHGQMEEAIESDHGISKTSIEALGSSSSLISKSTQQGNDLVDFREPLKIDARCASLLEKDIEETIEQCVEECPTSEKSIRAIISSMNSESRPLIPLQKASTQVINKKTLSEPLLTGHQEVDGKIEVANENDSISKTSISSPSPISQPLPSIIEALGSSFSVTSKSTQEGKDLVDFRGLLKIDARSASLLEEAIEKYPQLWDWQKNLRPKYCKAGYESLADMLLFLKFKTPKTMDESSKEEFGMIYFELDSFGFDKEWLTSIYQRVMDIVHVDNMELKKLDDLESQESSLVEQLGNVRDEIAKIKDKLCKYDSVFNF